MPENQQLQIADLKLKIAISSLKDWMSILQL
jgi:hypothetical protein